MLLFGFHYQKNNPIGRIVALPSFGFPKMFSPLFCGICLFEEINVVCDFCFFRAGNKREFALSTESRLPVTRPQQGKSFFGISFWNVIASLGSLLSLIVFIFWQGTNVNTGCSRNHACAVGASSGKPPHYQRNPIPPCIFRSAL